MTATKQTRRYRVLAGTHVKKIPLKPFADGTPNWEEEYYGPGKPKGDIVETDLDLLRLNGPGGMEPKFALADDPRQGMETEESLTARIKEDQRKLEEMKQAKQMPPSSQPAPPQPRGVDLVSTLNTMDLKQLRDHAAAEEVDVSKCKTKEEIVKVLLAGGR